MSGSGQKRVAVGLIFIIVGVFFLLDNMGYGLNIPRWVFSWPLIFVAMGVVNLLSGDLRVAVVFFSISAFFYLQRFDVIDMRTYWPILLVIIGFSFLLRNRRRNRIKPVNENYFDEVSIFGGIEKKLISQQLEGGRVTSVFGSSEIDLRGSIVKDGAIIEVFTMFGGCDIYVPKNWKVNVDTVAIFGGFSDSRTGIDPNATSSIRVKGFTMFGGGDIKN